MPLTLYIPGKSNRPAVPWETIRMMWIFCFGPMGFRMRSTTLRGSSDGGMSVVRAHEVQGRPPLLFS